MHLVHIALTIEFLNETIQFNGAKHLQILMGPFSSFIHFIHVSKQWHDGLDQIVFKFEYDEYLSGVDGGLNCILHLVTPIVLLEMLFIPKILGISMVNLNPKSYFPTLICKGC